MTSPKVAGRAARVLALAAACLGPTACLAAPPAESAPARLGTVRAATRARAEHVAELLDRLAPRVVEVVPGSRLDPLEVWVQEVPTLYRQRASTYSDTDGFWADGVRRIHLRESADQLERTLAHELVHASLEPAWDRLPGTLEEGVCDWVAAQLVPTAASRLRAGRLATAAAAIGGLPLEVELWLDVPSSGMVLAFGLQAQIRIVTPDIEPLAPTDVFVVRAGLSTVHAGAAQRRALYGLGFLVAERIAEREGLAGLYARCEDAQRAGRDAIPTSDLLAAADLGSSAESFRGAILESLGPNELREILRLHPAVLIEPVLDFLDCGEDGDPWADLAALRARVAVPGSRTAVVQIVDMTALRGRLEVVRALRAHPETDPVPCP